VFGEKGLLTYVNMSCVGVKKMVHKLFGFEEEDEELSDEECDCDCEDCEDE